MLRLDETDAVGARLERQEERTHIGHVPKCMQGSIERGAAL